MQASFRVQHSLDVWDVALQDNILATAGSDWQVKIWEVNPDRIQALGKLQGHSNQVGSIVLCDHLACSGADDFKIKLWDWRAQVCLQTLEGHTGYIYDLVFPNTSSDWLVSASADSFVKMWDLTHHVPLRSWQGHTALIFCLFPYENTLLSGSLDTTCRIWDIRSPECVQVLGHEARVTSISRLSSHPFVTASWKGLYVWDNRMYKVIKVFPTEFINCMEVLGNCLVVGDQVGMLRVFSEKNKEGCTYFDHKAPIRAIGINDHCCASADANGQVILRIV